MKAIQLLEKMEQTGKGLQLSKIHSIRDAFYSILSGWDEVQEKFELLDVIEEPTKELSLSARELRLKMSKIRTSAEKTRKAEKADCVKLGKIIDTLANSIKEELQPREERLKELEDHEKVKEENRLGEIQSNRIQQIYDLYKKYNEPLFADAVAADYSLLDESIFESTLLGMEETIHLSQASAKEMKRCQEAKYQKFLEKERIENEKLELKVKAEREENERLLAKMKKLEQEQLSKDEDAARERRLLKQKLLEEKLREQEGLDAKHKEETLALERSSIKNDLTGVDRENNFWKDVLILMSKTKESVNSDADVFRYQFENRFELVSKTIKSYL